MRGTVQIVQALLFELVEPASTSVYDRRRERRHTIWNPLLEPVAGMVGRDRVVGSREGELDDVTFLYCQSSRFEVEQGAVAFRHRIGDVEFDIVIRFESPRNIVGVRRGKAVMWIDLRTTVSLGPVVTAIAVVSGCYATSE
ncbi:hypothetical protein SAMN04489841_3686 [Natrinema salaciae]|uniref:Uncharacterized protein n=1 Tax=Natrinema salaciae TaxID=1186196 RepID=A0A1H9NPM2_9EURY|nr:hypothetical protein [Natrinema salaciae]SER37906.1 hypothetical protein SAMN04489841_3686 [Natrinema salaciae]